MTFYGLPSLLCAYVLAGVGLSLSQGADERKIMGAISKLEIRVQRASATGYASLGMRPGIPSLFHRARRQSGGRIVFLKVVWNDGKGSRETCRRLVVKRSGEDEEAGTWGGSIFCDSLRYPDSTVERASYGFTLGSSFNYRYDGSISIKDGDTTYSSGDGRRDLGGFSKEDARTAVYGAHSYRLQAVCYFMDSPGGDTVWSADLEKAYDDIGSAYFGRKYKASGNPCHDRPEIRKRIDALNRKLSSIPFVEASPFGDRQKVYRDSASCARDTLAPVIEITCPEAGAD
jgi:hypothetical protein